MWFKFKLHVGVTSFPNAIFTVAVSPSAKVTHLFLKDQMTGCGENYFCIFYFVALIYVSVFVAETMTISIALTF